MSRFQPTIKQLTKDILNGKFDEKIAKSIIDSQKVDINEQNEDGDTILHLCLKDHRFIEALWCIKNNIDPTLENNDGITSARVAIQRGNIEVVDTLINHSNIDLHQTDKNGRTLLQDAVIYGHQKMIKLLTHYIEDLNTVDIHNRNVAFDAINYGDSEIVSTLLENTELDLNIVDNSGETILHHKNLEDDEELSIQLLENGADPTICDKNGNNFLLKVALKGKYGENILKTAVRLGCNLNSKVSNKNSILMEVMFAFSKLPIEESKRRDELKEMAKTLINYGIDVNAVNNNNETVLFELIRIGNIEGCAFALENGLNVNQQNNNKETALLIAIYKGIKNIDIIILLLQYGAQPSIKNKNNQCVAEVLNNIILHTHEKKELKCQKTLNEINSNGNYLIILKEILGGGRSGFDYLDSNGNPLFFTPFLFNHTELTKLYLKTGVDINIKNESGNSLFYEYNLSVFEKGTFSSAYRTSLVFLLINKSNILAKNKDNQTIFSKISLIPNCNLSLFKELVETTNYDYSNKDNRGRTIMHSCVWGNNIELINVIYNVENEIQNIADNYNILPITYASLLGNQDIVNEFLKKDSNISTGKKIPKIIINNFKPMLKNLDSLTTDCEDKDNLRKLHILIDTVKRDFEVSL